MSWLKHCLELMINPFFLFFCFILVSALVLNKPNAVRPIRFCLWFLVLFFLIFSTGWLPRYLTSDLEARYSIVQQVDPEVKWVVVLGGGHSEQEGLPANDLLSGASVKRLLEGVRLLHDLPRAKLLLSGGGGSRRFSEAVLLNEVSQWFSIPKERVVLEASSANTEAQARALVPLLHQEPFYLVTSAIHMPRSMYLCKRQGLNPIPAPTDFTFLWSDGNSAKLFIPNVYNLLYFTIAAHELLGRAWASLNHLPGRPA